MVSSVACRFCRAVGIGDGELRYVVGGGVGAGMVFHIEPVEADCERQWLGRWVVVAVEHGVGVGRRALAQVYLPAFCTDVGDDCPDEDDSERGVEHGGGDGFCAVAYEMADARSRQRSPNERKPP